MSSGSEIRAALVDVLGKVEGITASRTVPAVILPGAAWPVRWRASWRNACASDQGWFAFVALPNVNREDMVDVGDELLDDVAEALFTYCQVALVEDWAWPVDGQQAVPVLRFTLNITT
jgi:hypothetical protein